jgi:formamidopyrimidine-DNA glycosylase
LPELPEVETMRRGILPVVGCRIESAERPPCSLRPILLQPRIDALNRRLRGRKISGIGRRGKRVVIETEGDQFLVIEPRMTGLVLLSDPPDPEHLRLKLHLSPGQGAEQSSLGAADDKARAGRPTPPRQLLFWDRRGLGTVRLLTAAQLDAIVDQKLGCDALEITAEQLRERLRTSQRAIKVALLDQGVVAGIGNLYAAEILFLAGIDPRTRCDRLTRRQWERIQRATRQVLLEAIEYEGSTLSDGTYRNALNGEGGYQHFHRVYDRKDTPCPRCRIGRIRRIVQAQRSTFFCPRCQQKRGCHPTLVVD